jgi:nucleotide-binding universal stress UspA family protein
MRKILFPFEIHHAWYKESYVYAVKLARNLGAELIVLNTFQIEAGDNITQSQYDQLVRNHWIRAHNEIIQFHDYYLNNYARVDSELRIKADHRFVHGNLISEFRKVMHSERIDMVVLPATGSDEPVWKNLKTLHRMTLDQNMASLMVTPCEGTFRPMVNILFAFVSGRIKGLSNHVNELLLMAGIYNATVHYVNLSKHRSPREDFDTGALRAIEEGHQKKRPFRVQGMHDRDAGNRLLEYISENDIQLVVIARHQLQLVGDLFRESVFEQICGTEKVPVLILGDRVLE